MRTSEPIGNKERRAAHEYQGGIEVFAILFDVVGVVLDCLLLVRCVKVETGIVGLDRLKESSESIFETTSGQRLEIQVVSGVERTTSG